MTTSGTVRAGRLDAPGQLAVVERSWPDPGPGSVLVAPVYVGLCGTDLDLVDGSMPYLHQGFASYPLQPGHEWSGTLLGDVEGMATGTRVVLDPVIDCGRADCRDCGAGFVVRCGHRKELGVRNGLDGALATAITVPVDYLLPIPDDVSTRDAALVEPMVTTLEGIRRTEPRAGELVLIVGAGTLGLVGVMALAARGISPHVLVRSRARAETVEAAGGIPWLAGSSAAAKAFDVVIEAAGTPGAVAAALQHVAPGGRVTLLGVPTRTVEVDVSALVVNDITIRGVLNGPGQYPAALAALTAGEVRAELLIDRVYPLEDIEGALARSRQLGRPRPKVLVDVTGSRSW